MHWFKEISGLSTQEKEAYLVGLVRELYAAKRFASGAGALEYAAAVSDIDSILQHIGEVKASL